MVSGGATRSISVGKFGAGGRPAGFLLYSAAVTAVAAIVACSDGAAGGGVPSSVVGSASPVPSVEGTPVVDAASFLGGVFQGRSTSELPAVVSAPDGGGLSDLESVDDLNQSVGESARLEFVEQAAGCIDAWRSSVLSLGVEADYSTIEGAMTTFRNDFPDCDGEVWRMSLREEASPACSGVMYAEGLGPLNGPGQTGWHSEGRALWVNFENSPLGTGGGCWFYSDVSGWLVRSGDGGVERRLLTIYEMGEASPGMMAFRDNAILNCDHRLRAHILGLDGPLGSDQLLEVVHGFVNLPGNVECAGVGWMPVAVHDSSFCHGVPGGVRVTGVYEDGAVVVHWSEESVLGTGGQCWVYDSVEGAWFRSLDRGELPQDGSEVAPATPGGIVGQAEGRAFEVSPPVAGNIAILDDDAPLLADPGRSEVCDLILKSVLLLNPAPRTPPDFASLINAIQHGVEGGVCVSERWSPGVRGRMLRDTAAGVVLPDALRNGTGYDLETGSIRVVFFDGERPFDGAGEWIWLSGGVGWQSLP